MREISVDVPESEFTVKFGEHKMVFMRMSPTKLKEFQKKFKHLKVGVKDDLVEISDEEAEKRIDDMYAMIEFLVTDTTLSISELKNYPTAALEPLLRVVLEEQGLGVDKKK